MIIDTLAHRHRYTGVPGLSEMLDAMAELDDGAAPGTRLELGDDIGTVAVAEFTSLDPQVQTRFEAHRRFIDVHVVLAGQELLDVAALDALTVATEFDEGSDIGFHDGERTVSVTLRPGWFVVCFPHDAHRPGVWVDGPARVLKAVGKLKVW